MIIIHLIGLLILYKIFCIGILFSIVIAIIRSMFFENRECFSFNLYCGERKK